MMLSQMRHFFPAETQAIALVLQHLLIQHENMHKIQEKIYKESLLWAVIFHKKINYIFNFLVQYN